jgi:MoxR-like ATPase
VAKTQTPNQILGKVQGKGGIVGRGEEVRKLSLMLLAGRNVLIEGPVGAGKTALAQAVAEAMGRSVIRVDGDSRFTEQKLTGWFDPAMAMKKGFNAKTFVEGPLVDAMKRGAILFINELNRMPEAVQNVLLPAIDEGVVQIPQLGEVKAKPGFLLVATQNPREFVATSHLSEALMDRMEWLSLAYQPAAEERAIVLAQSGFKDDRYLDLVVELTRITRHHPKIKRGASVRAAIAIARILAATKEAQGKITDQDFLDAVMAALPTRIELFGSEADGGAEAQTRSLVMELFEEVKKNS